MRFEDWLRRLLDRRWRARATVEEVDRDLEQRAIEAELVTLAEESRKLTHRLALLTLALRSDGWERAELVAAYSPPQPMRGP